MTDAERYQYYLAGREWGLLREAVRKRCDDVCERCHHFPMSHVHHLTYIRKYRERLDDLQGLCVGCHEFTHGKTDRDPRLDIPWTPAVVVTVMRRLGVILEPHGDMLRFDAPRGLINPEFVEILRRHKPGIMNILRSESTSTPRSPVNSEPPA